ncbi:unnamed protein product [Cylindrotheca closterium]|uniref:Uncharacterized protein n=1 Tax=Cylindrotheca closterium TaxID=2856 RepID=A0AAD2FWT8_9STRA|nr:unnamed protein product [Cylindrotheca closterium]
MSDDGNSLFIRGENAKGIWERELVTSGTEVGKPEFEPLLVPIMTADSEKVEAETWWEGGGAIHVSILHGVLKQYGGGAFESRRFLEDDRNASAAAHFISKMYQESPVCRLNRE